MQRNILKYFLILNFFLLPLQPATATYILPAIKNYVTSLISTKTITSMASKKASKATSSFFRRHYTTNVNSLFLVDSSVWELLNTTENNCLSHMPKALSSEEALGKSVIQSIRSNLQSLVGTTVRSNLLKSPSSRLIREGRDEFNARMHSISDTSFSLSLEEKNYCEQAYKGLNRSYQKFEEVLENNSL